MLCVVVAVYILCNFFFYFNCLCILLYLVRSVEQDIIISATQMLKEIAEVGDGTHAWKRQASVKTKSLLNVGGQGRNG